MEWLVISSNITPQRDEGHNTEIMTFIMAYLGELGRDKAKSALSVRKRGGKYPQSEEEVNETFCKWHG